MGENNGLKIVSQIQAYTNNLLPVSQTRWEQQDSQGPRYKKHKYTKLTVLKTGKAERLQSNMTHSEKTNRCGPTVCSLCKLKESKGTGA